jgi:hypothetical protein
MQRSNQDGMKNLPDFAAFQGENGCPVQHSVSDRVIIRGKKNVAIGDTGPRLQLPVGGADNMTVSWHRQPNRVLRSVAGG